MMDKKRVYIIAGSGITLFALVVSIGSYVLFSNFNNDMKSQQAALNQSLAAEKEKAIAESKKNLETAKQKIQQNDLEGAIKDLTLAVSQDSGNEEAKRMLSDAKNKEITQLQSIIDEAKKAIGENRLSDAIGTLKNATLYKDNSQEVQSRVSTIKQLLNETTLNRWKSYVGNWGDVSTQYRAYEQMQIMDVKDNKLSIVMKSVGDPPSSRVATFETEADIKDGNTAEFTFTDSWENKGKGTIQLGSNEIKVTTELTDRSKQNGEIANGTRNFPKIDDARIAEAKKKDDVAVQKKVQDDIKKLAHVVREVGTLKFYVTKVEYSNVFNLSNIYYSIENSPKADKAPVGLFDFVFYDSNDKQIGKAYGAVAALPPGKGLNNMTRADGDFRNYSYFDVEFDSSNSYPTSIFQDPYGFKQ
jgi:hypothetical protein